MSAEESARSVRQTQGLDPVRAFQRVLYRSAKQDRTRRFHALYDKLVRSDVMWRAWVDVATNKGAPGVDGVSIADIEAGGTESVRAFLDGLAAELRSGTYRPKPLRRVHIPKPGKQGETRPLGIPTIADRVIMAAAKIVLEPIFEADFHPVSFGFRPKRSAQQALEVVRQTANGGRGWVLDADIKACFDNIDHDALMAQVQRRVVDRQMLKLLACLASGWSVRGRGGLRYRGRNPARFACFAPARQHRSPRLRRGMGKRWTSDWGRWSVFATTSLSSVQRGNEPSRLVTLLKRPWHHSGCNCIPTRPGSWNFGKEQRALTSWAFTIGW